MPGSSQISRESGVSTGIPADIRPDSCIVEVSTCTSSYLDSQTRSRSIRWADTRIQKGVSSLGLRENAAISKAPEYLIQSILCLLLTKSAYDYDGKHHPFKDQTAFGPPA